MKKLFLKFLQNVYSKKQKMKKNKKKAKNDGRDNTKRQALFTLWSHLAGKKKKWVNNIKRRVNNNDNASPEWMRKFNQVSNLNWNDFV